MTALKASPVHQFLDLTRAALSDGSFVKLTLSAPRQVADGPALKNIQIRAVDLKGVVHLSFVYHHATRDITKNLLPDEGLALIGEVLGTDFRHAHLFTTQGTAQLELRDGHGARLRRGPPRHEAPPSRHHDQPRQRRLDPARPWLRDLGVTTASGEVARGMEAKFRQIDKFLEVFSSLAAQADLASVQPLTVADMGCGKGYLTFAIHDWLQTLHPGKVDVRGREARPELVGLCQRIAQKHGLTGLHFEAGTIAEAPLQPVNVLIALHACDTATDDAIARGIAAEARLILVSPCCHKELRPQLTPPPPLQDAFRHGILRERQAEFITDALRAALLEWAGYDTRVFEFIATEHTAKNLMIAAIRRPGPDRTNAAADQVRALAAAYGITTQRLAALLHFPLT